MSNLRFVAGMYTNPEVGTMNVLGFRVVGATGGVLKGLEHGATRRETIFT